MAVSIVVGMILITTLMNAEAVCPRKHDQTAGVVG